MLRFYINRILLHLPETVVVYWNVNVVAIWFCWRLCRRLTPYWCCRSDGFWCRPWLQGHPNLSIPVYKCMIIIFTCIYPLFLSLIIGKSWSRSVSEGQDQGRTTYCLSDTLYFIHGQLEIKKGHSSKTRKNEWKSNENLSAVLCEHLNTYECIPSPDVDNFMLTLYVLNCS